MPKRVGRASENGEGDGVRMGGVGLLLVEALW